MKTVIRIAIVDDHQLFSQTLAMLLNAEPDMELLLVAASGPLFLQALENTTLIPDIVLMDIDMPEMDGLTLNRLLRERYPSIKVIMLSMHLEDSVVTRVIEDGASSYLTKNCDKSELIQTIKAVYEKGFYVNQLILQALTRPNRKATKITQTTSLGLSRREVDVLLLICQEYNTVEIAEKLFISVRTVEGHRLNLLTKTGCKNQVGLVLFAIKHQLFQF